MKTSSLLMVTVMFVVLATVSSTVFDRCDTLLCPNGAVTLKDPRGMCWCAPPENRCPNDGIFVGGMCRVIMSMIPPRKECPWWKKWFNEC